MNIQEYCEKQQKGTDDFLKLLDAEKTPTDHRLMLLQIRALNDIHSALILVAERLEASNNISKFKADL